MTQVDFYVLKERASGNRYTLACRLSEKIYHQGRRIFIHTGSEEETRHLDRLLWTFRQGSFVPHGIDGSCDPAVNVLINLAGAVPGFFSRFERVAEIIDKEPQVIADGRDRFRFYRDRGYPLNKHDIS
ncbi:MAG: DNA polymerase III subunit chi [Candidatus Thiodiazotropha sp.]